MTTKETAVILGILKTAYPRFYTDMGQDEINNTINLWTEMLSDYPVEVVKIAVKKLISELIFPPTIADVRKALVESTEQPELTADQAWGQVTNAIRAYGSYRETEALESMDKQVTAVVKRFGWKNLCQSETSMADRAHFIKVWELGRQERQKQKQIPKDIRQQITNNMMEKHKISCINHSDNTK